MSRNLYAVILGGPDAYSTDSWHARAADGSARLQRCDEAGRDSPTNANRGSHAHVIYITVEQAPITSVGATSPGAQTALDQLHRFHGRCAMGQDELVEATAQTEVNLFNYYQEVATVASDVKVLGYAAVGKMGARSDAWLPYADWAHDVLHAANLQTEWSEQVQLLRSVAGRLAAVVRMPFCQPGVVAASAALPNIPQCL